MMVEFITPTKEIKGEPVALRFQEGGRGIIFYPDGDVLIHFEGSGDYDERYINLFKAGVFDALFDYIYDNDPRHQSSVHTMIEKVEE